MTVSEEALLTALEAGDFYAGFARAFRYPEGEDSVLSSAEYLEAFDPSASTSGTSVHESAYVDRDSSGLFEELVRFYEHFGLRRNQDANLPDHVSVELEFMHFLCQLEYHAHAKGEDVSSVQKAQLDFIDRHLKRLLMGLLHARKGRGGMATELITSCLEFVQAHRQALAPEA